MKRSHIDLTREDEDEDPAPAPTRPVRIQPARGATVGSRRLAIIKELFKEVRLPPMSEEAIMLWRANTRREAAAVLDMFLPARNSQPADRRAIIDFIMEEHNFRDKGGTRYTFDRVVGRLTSDLPDYLTIMRFLDPDGWLESSGIDSVGLIIEKQHEADSDGGILYLPTYTWTGNQLLSMEKRALAPCRLIVSPVCMNGNHWTLLVVLPTQGFIHFFDSYKQLWDTYMPMNPFVVTGLAWLRTFLAKNFPAHDWTEEKAPVIDVSQLPNYPRQNDGNSCGLYALRTIELLADNSFAPFSRRTWDDMSYEFRERYTAWLLKYYIGPVVVPEDADDEDSPRRIVSDLGRLDFEGSEDDEKNANPGLALLAYRTGGEEEEEEKKIKSDIDAFSINSSDDDDNDGNY